MEVLHQARDGCAEGVELGARGDGGEVVVGGVFNGAGKERTRRGAKRSNKRSV